MPAFEYLVLGQNELRIRKVALSCISVEVSHASI